MKSAWFMGDPLAFANERTGYNVATVRASAMRTPGASYKSGSQAPFVWEAQPFYPFFELQRSTLHGHTREKIQVAGRTAAPRFVAGRSWRSAGVTGAAIGHYETGLSKPSPDRAVQLAKLLRLKPQEVSASETGSNRKPVYRPRSASAKQRASVVADAKAPSHDEGAVLDALRSMPAAERRVVMKLVLAYKLAGLRNAAGQHG